MSRWSPTLPSLGGRLSPRVSLPDELIGKSYHSRLEWYYLQRGGSPSIFVRNVDKGWLRRTQQTPYLRGTYRLQDLEPSVLYQYLMDTFGSTTMSKHFQRKLSQLCRAGKIGDIKRWYHTVDGLVLPILLTAVDPDAEFSSIDRMISFGFENCANNYSHFISRMKKLKKLLRKDWATGSDLARSVTDLATYRKLFLNFLTVFDDEHSQAEVLLTWTQTRASGLADPKMVRKSLDKAEATLSLTRRVYLRGSDPNVISPAYMGEPVVPQDILSRRAKMIASRIRGATAHLSAGPHACFEVTQASGGQTAAIRALCRGNYLYRSYNFEDLSFVTHEARPCRTSGDLLSWAIQEVHERPLYVRCVRLHAVAEPSKARTITVGTLPYQLILGAVAKILQPSISSGVTRTGLKGSRNLYRFLNEDLDPQNGLWGSLRPRPGGKVYGLSCDLEEATDYGDLAVARQILQGILQECRGIDGFPMGLAVLAKTLYLGPRYCFRPIDQKYRLFIKRTGWLMGDRLTKVILTLAHEIAVLQSGLTHARVCGDDVVAMSNDRRSLEGYYSSLEALGFKISVDDYFISDRLIFYCEEGALVPRRAQDLPSVSNRRKEQSTYVDYVRIRLLIPTQVETHQPSYTDIGRFSLLGKEARWVHQNCGPRTRNLFTCGSLLQHLSVPQPSDTLCPYLPHELAGDGAFPHSAEFLFEVLRTKSRNLSETVYRIHTLMKSKWGFKYVRSDILDNVIHKYHMMVPKVNQLEELLPPDAIIRGSDKLLSSIKCDGAEDPERVFLRLYRSYYWYCILNGLKEPSLDFSVDRLASHAGGHEWVPNFRDLESFYETWRDRGFTFGNVPAYLVRVSRIEVADHLSLGWSFRHGDPVPDPASGLIQDYHAEAFLDHIQLNEPLPAVVKDLLHKFVETDTYLLHEVSQLEPIPELVVLISGDKNLGYDIARLLVTKHRNKLTGVVPYVVLIPPSDYQEGRLDLHLSHKIFDLIPEYITLVDFGQLNFLAFTRDPRFQDIINPVVVHERAREIETRSALYNSVWQSFLVGDEDRSTVWSLTSRPLNEWKDNLPNISAGDRRSTSFRTAILEHLSESCRW